MLHSLPQGTAQRDPALHRLGQPSPGHCARFGCHDAGRAGSFERASKGREAETGKDPEGKACEEQLRSFVLLSPEQRKLRVSSHYQCSSSFPCCPIFRSQKKTNAIYISSALGCFCTFQYEPPTVYQVFDIPAHVCQTVTSPGFWRDTSLSESTQRKLLG